MNCGLFFGEADGEAGVEGIAGANGVHGIDAQRGNRAHTSAASPKNALGAAREHHVFRAEVEQGAGEFVVVGRIVGRQSEADAGFCFIRRQGKHTRQIGFANDRKQARDSGWV